MKKFPVNGYELLEARKKGLKPKGVVLVTDWFKADSPCKLVVKTGERYAFPMVKGLDVFLILLDYEFRWVDASYRKWLDATTKSILAGHPASLYVIPPEVAWN